MQSSPHDEFAALLEKLAEDSVLLDLTSEEEINSFVNRLEKLTLSAPDKGAGNIAQVISRITEAIGECRNDKASLEKIINVGISFLKSNTHSSLESPADISRVLKSLEAIRENAPSKLTSLQMNEIPQFIKNSLANLERVEHYLLDPSSSADLIELVEQYCCFLTQIKAEAELLGLCSIVDFACSLEDICRKMINSGSLQEFFKITTQASENLREIIEILRKDFTSAREINTGKYIESLRVQSGQQGKTPPQDDSSLACIPQLNLAENKEMLCEFISEAREHLSAAEHALLELEQSFADEPVNTIFRAFHTIKGVASFLDLKAINTLAHQTETMMDAVRKKTLEMNSEVADAVLMAIDLCSKLINLLSEQIENQGVLKNRYPDIGHALNTIRGISQKAKDPSKKKLGEILVKNGAVEEPVVDAALQVQKESMGQRMLGEILVSMNSATQEQVDKALKEQQSIPADQAVKISVSKLDSLIDMVGELVIAGTQVLQSHAVTQAVDASLTKDAAGLGRIIRDVQDTAMSMRLVPIKPVFQKMQRLLRDVSKKSGKNVEMILKGEDTEIDKNIIDLLGDPLMHMIRNSVDHGIEGTQERQEKGKSPAGKIELEAFHKGGNILIQIRDDGRGLDKDKILRKAVERGLAKADEQLSEQRVFGFIFEPGFSTAEKVTDISGRGVGMDVVRRNIEQLRGTILTESTRGKGTVFTLKLPLTLAIIDGIVVSVTQKRYILPIFSVMEFLQANDELFTSVNTENSVVRIHDRLIPVIRLDRLLNRTDSTSKTQTLCVIDSDYGMYCLVVDSIIGQQQVVIKNLGDNFRQVKGVSGATILGDGVVGLILDVNGIVKMWRGE